MKTGEGVPQGNQIHIYRTKTCAKSLISQASLVARQPSKVGWLIGSRKQCGAPVAVSGRKTRINAGPPEAASGEDPYAIAEAHCNNRPLVRVSSGQRPGAEPTELPVDHAVHDDDGCLWTDPDTDAA